MQEEATKNKRYNELKSELDEAKMEIMKLKEMKLQPMGEVRRETKKREMPTYKKESSPVKKSYPVPLPSFYTLDEMK